MFLKAYETTDWPDDLSMRRANPDDAGFYYRLTHEVLFEHVVNTWGNWDADMTWQNAQDFTRSSGSWVMLVNGWSAGLIDVSHREADVFVVDLYVLSEHQNQGLASHVMGCLITYAQPKKLPIRLGVLRVNIRAKIFYERLAFLREREDAHYIYMILHP